VHAGQPQDPTQGPSVETTLDIQYISALGVGGTSWIWNTNGPWMYEFCVELQNAKQLPSVISMSYAWSEYDSCGDTTNANCTGLGVNATGMRGESSGLLAGLLAGWLVVWLVVFEILAHLCSFFICCCCFVLLSLVLVAKPAGYVQRANQEFAKVGLLGVTMLSASGDSGCHGRTDSGTAYGIRDTFPSESFEHDRKIHSLRHKKSRRIFCFVSKSAFMLSAARSTQKLKSKTKCSDSSMRVLHSKTP
jgi:hypothetical protein